MMQYKYYLFDMGSALPEFHNPEWNEPEILNAGHNRLINHISTNYGKVIAEKIDNNVIMPWYNYIETKRKIQRIEYRIDEALFFEFAKLGINISYKEINEILKTDIEGAKKSGLSACLYTGYKKKVTKTQADYIITNFREGLKQASEILPLVLTWVLPFEKKNE